MVPRDVKEFSGSTGSAWTQRRLLQGVKIGDSPMGMTSEDRHGGSWVALSVFVAQNG